MGGSSLNATLSDSAQQSTRGPPGVPTREFIVMLTFLPPVAFARGAARRPAGEHVTDPTVSTAQGVTTRRRSYLALVPGSPEPASCNLMTSKNYTTKSSPSGPAAKIRRKKTVILEARRRSRSLRPLRAPPGGIFSAAGARGARLNAGSAPPQKASKRCPQASRWVWQERCYQDDGQRCHNAPRRQTSSGGHGLHRDDTAAPAAPELH